MKEPRAIYQSFIPIETCCELAKNIFTLQGKHLRLHKKERTKIESKLSGPSSAAGKSSFIGVTQ